MRQAQHVLHISTRGKGLVEFTREATQWVRSQRISTGLLTIFCRHTSASLLIQENADPDVRTDLVAYFDRAVPEDKTHYVHQAEGPDDMPAHIKASLTNVQLSIPVIAGEVALGTWQGLYLFEHRHAPHRREIVLHLIGE
jgi:secondary thiamine-phosphate synthase enzyme